MCLLSVCVAGSSSGNPELDYHLAVLKAVHGVTGVNHFGKEGSGKQYGVFLWVRTHPEADRQPIRVPCSSVVGTTKLDAALVATLLPTTLVARHRAQFAAGAGGRAQVQAVQVHA